ncbi:MAG: hypothetical protein WC449_02785 [Candidatus Paceibacterota bacterium]
MGGGGGSYSDSYDRNVFKGKGSSGGFDYSDDSDRVFNGQSLHKDLNPFMRDIRCEHKNPIVVAVDVTGSMGDWTKIIYDKLPMFWGEMDKNAYLPDPSICIVGVGDAYSDQAPLQVCDFAQGQAIDEEIAKLYLEGGGGGQSSESYELMAHYFSAHCDISRSELSFFFLLEDEGVYPKLKRKQVEEVIGESLPSDIPSEEIFQKISARFNFFVLHKPYDGGSDDAVCKKWKSLIGERFIELKDPKACVDDMLGIISMISQARDLDSYAIDMVNRGQSKSRIQEVTKALNPLAEKLALAKVDCFKDLGEAIRKNKGGADRL